jgi:hypothetical protein
MFDRTLLDRTTGDTPAQASTTTAPVEIKTKTPKQKLFDLETEAQQKGMSLKELADIQKIGECDLQVKERIAMLEMWLVGR